LAYAIIALADRLCGHQFPSKKERQLTKNTNGDLACTGKMIVTTDVSVIRKLRLVMTEKT